jgi:connector enhancer of kinase suppressor of Ras 2
VKSRKYAFKVYYTGTVFYFAADTDDTFIMWLEAINRVTSGTEPTSGLFSETDESDRENIINVKSSSIESKPLTEKTFGSLKKLGKKDSTVKDHEISGASLDRKYLKFLGAKTHNIPVPTAQFRSYRRVLPTSTSSRLLIHYALNTIIKITYLSFN